MKIKELIAAARGIRRRPERGAVQAPPQSDAVRMGSGDSSELTPEQATGRWQLVGMALIGGAQAAAVLTGVAPGPTAAWWAGVAVAVLVALARWAPTLARHAVAWLFVFGSLGAVGAAVSATGTARVAYLASIVLCSWSASWVERSRVIDAYVDGDRYADDDEDEQEDR